jgi:hypothetical protein
MTRVKTAFIELGFVKIDVQSITFQQIGSYMLPRLIGVLRLALLTDEVVSKAIDDTTIDTGVIDLMMQRALEIMR